MLGPGALGRPRGMGWRGRGEGGSGWGTRVNPWLIHVNVWQKPLQYYKVISVQLIKINGKKNKVSESGIKAWKEIKGLSYNSDWFSNCVNFLFYFNFSFFIFFPIIFIICVNFPIVFNSLGPCLCVCIMRYL